MSHATFTIRELLDEELNRRYYASGISLTTEDLFDRDKLIPWINALVGKSISGKLSACIDHTSTARLSHAAAVFLLGMALRSRLGLRFDKMPRIIAHSASDGFHFFWSMICLCHDLGYRFENESRSNRSLPQKMNTSEGRKELLGIDHDLFLVDRAVLTELGIDPDSEEGRWILESVELTVKYDRYRRRSLEPDKNGVADHGICGALLLYDILRTECEEMRLKRKMRQFDHPNRHSETEPAGNLDGAAKDSSPTRFIRCGLLIACTVARHNMWLADQRSKPLYRKYRLDALFADRPGVKICPNKSLEQMLFFLDFVDTIDPVKWFHLRAVEADARKPEADRKTEAYWKNHRAFVLNRLSIRFFQPHRRSKTRKFALVASPSNQTERERFLHYYRSGCEPLTDWLALQPPRRDGKSIIFRLPFVPGTKNDWPCDITDHEINSLLLYMGCGVPGLYGAFYSSSRAYQTLNLLMMEGNQGEQIRVCQEKQKPNGIFLLEWKRSLRTMEDIFRAQCKYARQNPMVEDVLFRSDRQLNFKMMTDRNATYAMTSTSQGSYLPEFLVNKVAPHVLRLRMTEPIPYFDYEGFFGDEYVYAEEREILLPPMISIKTAEQPSFILTAKESGAAEDKVVQWYDVDLFTFDPGSGWAEDWTGKSGDNADLDYLKANAEDAANALDGLVKTHDWPASPLRNDTHIYWEWKKAYRRVLTRRMRDIYKAEFFPND